MLHASPGPLTLTMGACRVLATNSAECWRCISMSSLHGKLLQTSFASLKLGSGFVSICAPKWHWLKPALNALCAVYKASTGVDPHQVELLQQCLNASFNVSSGTLCFNPLNHFYPCCCYSYTQLTHKPCPCHTCIL